MMRYSSLCLTIAAGALAVARTVHAQVTAQGTVTVQAQPAGACPPGQPCVVVVPQQQAAPQPSQPQPYVAQPQPYVAQPQPYVAQPQPVVYAQPQPQAVQVTRTRLRWGMIGPGIGLVIGGWIGNWFTAAFGVLGLSSTDAGNYVAWSWVPIVGPWVNAGYWTRDDGMVGLHAVWGVLQAGGLLLCILGTALQEEVVETRYVERDDGIRLALLPWASQEGGGLTVRIAGF